MLASQKSAAAFDARAHIRRACLGHILISVAALLLCPLFLLIPDTEDYRLVFLKWVVGIGGPLAALWNLIRNIRFLNNPFSYPAFQWRDHGTPEQIAALIEREMSATEHHETVGKVTLTPRWLVRATPLALVGIPYAQMVWAYKKVIKRRAFYGLVTVGRDYALSVSTRNAKTQILSRLSETQVDALLTQVAHRAPWAIVGFSKETVAMWEKRNTEFMQTVDARREQARQREEAEAAGLNEFDLAVGTGIPAPNNPW